MPVIERTIERREVPADVAAPVAVVAETSWRLSALARIEAILYFVLSVVSALILVRFALVFMNANMEAGFSQWIMGVTTPLVAPFNGLIGSGHLELGDILAIIVYSVATALVAKLLHLVMAPSATIVSA